jgi:penicillin-binding protein 1A
LEPGALRAWGRGQAIEKVDEIGNEAVGSLNKTGDLTVSEMRWARKPNSEVSSTGSSVKNVRDVLRAGDVVLVQIKEEAPKPYDWKVSLEQEPEVQGALFCMETASGKVKAMVGGHHFSESQFNRAVQARRQPGSSFKPIIYAAALDWGMTPSSVILDAPYVSSNNLEDAWRPKNFRETFSGPTLFRDALIQSRNVITVKILKEIGVPFCSVTQENHTNQSWLGSS